MLPFLRVAAAMMLAALSVGWILPLYLSCLAYLSFVNGELYPRLLGKTPMNSFPFLPFCQECLAWSCGWLALVLLFWAYIGATRLLRRTS